MEQVQNNQSRKSLFKRWWFWVALVLLIPIGVAIYYSYVQIWKATFRGNELEQANAALAAGITLTDPKDDFVIVESNDEKVNAEKTSSPYRIPQLDVKSLQMGADEAYLYIKVSFYAKTDRSPLEINGDKIHSYGVNFDITEASGRILSVLHTNSGWWPIFGIPINGTYYSTGPTGIEWPESARFSTENRDSKVAGGAGTDYLLGRFPLKNLGLKFGDKMFCDLEVEGGSDKYSHAAADPFLGTGKAPAMITWTIGSKDYQINNNPDPYFSDQDKKEDQNETKEDAKSKSAEVTDFESCAKKYPVLETYPEQCKTPDGRSFTKQEVKK